MGRTADSDVDVVVVPAPVLDHPDAAAAFARVAEDPGQLALAPASTLGLAIEGRLQISIQEDLQDLAAA